MVAMEVKDTVHPFSPFNAQVSYIFQLKAPFFFFTISLGLVNGRRWQAYGVKYWTANK